MDMALRDTIAEELRALRRLSGPLDSTKMVHAPHILKGLGGGDADVAALRLLAMRSEHEEDRDIVAAMASIGYGSASETVLDRLTDYGAQHYVDARTVRRWSDTGIQKLATLILTKGPWIDPRIEFGITIAATYATVALNLEIPRNIGMAKPELTINHNEIDIDLTRSKRDPSADGYRTESFRVELIDGDPVLHARLAWRGEKVPVFICTASESGGRSVSSYLSLFGLEVRVRRLSDSQ